MQFELRRVRAGPWLRAAIIACCALALPALADELRSLEGANLSLKMSDALRAPASVATRTPLMRPAALKDYRIGAEDLLEIQVYGVDQLSRTVRVNSQGFISLPLIGTLAVGGMTAQEAETTVAARLATDYMQDPQVSLFIKEYTTQRVTIEGAVNKPGIYPLRGETTLLRSLAIAGGQAHLSDMSEVMLFRADASGKRVAMAYDVDRIRRGELDDPAVLNDDLIVVNRSAARTILKDSLFRDVIDAVNPFSPFAPR
jgi:polysaccharide biosynthesis/export protein